MWEIGGSNLVGRVLLTAILLMVGGDPVWSQVRGVVLDSEMGRPLIGALVTVQATAVQTETERLGDFNLVGAQG